MQSTFPSDVEISSGKLIYTKPPHWVRKLVTKTEEVCPHSLHMNSVTYFFKKIVFES